MPALGSCGLLHVFNPAIDGTIASTVPVPSWQHCSHCLPVHCFFTVLGKGNGEELTAMKNLSFMLLRYDARNDVLPCWMGPTNSQTKWLRSRSAEITAWRRILWLLILSCWKMNCEVWTRKSCTGHSPVRSATCVVVDAALLRGGKSRRGGHRIANISRNCGRI